MKYRYQSGDSIYDLSLDRHGDGYRVMVNGETYYLEILDAQPGALSLHFAAQSDGAAGPFRPETVYWAAEGDVKWLSFRGCTYRLEPPREQRRRGPAGAGAAQEDTLRAPMPAQVRDVQVTEGDAVEAGQTLLLLEAMKMEIRLAAPRSGRIVRLFARQGETVERDQVLVEIGDQ